MNRTAFPTIAAAWIAWAALPLSARQADHIAHGGHRMAQAMAAAQPGEPGDGAFAAIAEIVAILDADPDTDWGRVDTDGLRAHLVDMNQLILGARVRSTPLPDGLRMRIDTGGRAGAAASRMVPAHGPVLAAQTGWQSRVESDGDGLLWTVTDADPTAAARLKAQGFFGLIATGDHHRAHHLALARGAQAH